MKVDRHFIKEKLESGVICLPFIRSEEQMTDILIKGIPVAFFDKVLSKLGIGDSTTQLEGEC